MHPGVREHRGDCYCVDIDSVKLRYLTEHTGCTIPATGKAPIGEGLFDDDPVARLMSLGQRRTGRSLQQVPRRLDGLEDTLAIDARFERLPDRVGLARTADGETDRNAFI